MKIFRRILPVLLACPMLASACSCAFFSQKTKQEKVQELWRESSMVVYAEVQTESSEVRMWDDGTTPHRYQRAKWRVVQAWKGVLDGRSLIETNTDVTGGMCGRYVEAGQRWLLYFGNAPYSVGTCGYSSSGEAALSQFNELARLRKKGWPNQSLEPTRVGKPPLAAQLQR
ncbi:hypothetical protein [Pelomonas sp. SE-A7]|uniref:hypothetical protein n=1 Tax=Pelomonas sp. SE-A7 TaxID=3054953 RepID=UPI00259CCE57|nr:hypothetical protein [Pelomonas sp. SE-A7]MDM4768552.1 hypothetical protein [Pelomonas sp. SE-A7]